jgi:hypothetical protein
MIKIIYTVLPELVSMVNLSSRVLSTTVLTCDMTPFVSNLILAFLSKLLNMYGYDCILASFTGKV